MHKAKTKGQEYRDKVTPVGKIFGQWVVVDNTTSTRTSRGVLCKCTCGTLKKVYVNDLVTGKSSRCLKCARADKHLNEAKRHTFKAKRPKVGDRFGHWTVLHPMNPDNSITCVCECGNKRDLQLGNLTLGKTLSCGCVDTWSSSGEKELKGWLRTLGFNPKKSRKMGFEIDLFIESKQLGIEYNGNYWHSETLGRDRNYHLGKTISAKNNNIRLIHVWEHVWRRRPRQLKNFLTSALGCNKHRVWARKTTVQEIPKKIAWRFQEATHIQGKDSNAVLFLALVYNRTIVALASFGRHPRDSSKWTLSRFSCLPNHTVVGGLSKLSKHGIDILNVDTLISWADRDVSEARGYIEAGWEIDGILPPDYFYVKGLKVCSKQSRKKSNVNTPPDITEREHAEKEGWHRVWNTGKVRLTFTKKPNKMN